MKKRIAIWASGSGTNAENIIKQFENYDAEVSLIISSSPVAGVIKRAIKYRVPYEVISKSNLNNPNYMLPLLHNYGIDVHVLAGFLLKIPSYLIRDIESLWLNIHPSLLPAYGGKGMYGNRVHTSVISNKEAKSGITIHKVNEHYDEGDIVFQKEVEIARDEDADSLAEKIHELEYRYYPTVIKEMIEKNDI